MNDLTHPQVQHLLDQQADGLLPREDQIRVNAHLSTCPVCQDYARALTGIETRLRGGLHRRWDFVRTPNLHAAPALGTYSKRKLMQKQTFRLVRFAFLTGFLLLVLVGSLDWFLSTPTNKPDDTVPVQTPALVQVTTPVEETVPAMPEGWLVYTTFYKGSSEIYLTNATGTERINLSQTQGFNYDPVWSPDGQRIAFVSDRKGDYQIYVMNANGTGVTQLTSRTQLSELSFCSTRVSMENVKIESSYFGLSWSPNGETLVATLPMNIDGNAFEPLFLIRADGSGIIQLTEGNDVMSQWSPDGQRILFYRLADCEANGQNLFSIRPDGTGLTNLTNNPAPKTLDFAWSPDGTKIAFISSHIELGNETFHKLQLMNADGSAIQTLYNEPAPKQITYAGSLAWSPDGKTLAFVMPGDNDTLMHLINSDGTNLRPLTTAADHYFDLDWSPDGNWMAFTVGIDTPILYVLDVRNAPSLPDEWIRLTPPNTQNFDISWQPDPGTSSEVVTIESLTPQLTSIQMFDEQNGWGFATNFTSGLILHTQDGGITWQNVTPKDTYYINAQFMLDAQTGFIFLANDNDFLPEDALDNLVPENQLLRTQDSGKSWQSFTVPFANYPYLWFRNANLGWAKEDRLCENGPGICSFALYQTNDGGQTWPSLNLSDPLDPARPFPFAPNQQIWFRDTTMAWIGGKTINPDFTIPLYVTHDNGQTWQEKQILIAKDNIAWGDGLTYSLPIILSDDLIYQVVTYRVSNNGVSSYPVPVLLVTRDGGETWALNPMPKTWNGAIDFVNPLDAFAICGSALCVSHDGAQTWESLTSTLDFTYTDTHHIQIDFVSPTTGWAVEYKPDTQMRWILYQTTDGGQTWTEISPVIWP